MSGQLGTLPKDTTQMAETFPAFTRAVEHFIEGRRLIFTATAEPLRSRPSPKPINDKEKDQASEEFHAATAEPHPFRPPPTPIHDKEKTRHSRTATHDKEKKKLSEEVNAIVKQRKKLLAKKNAELRDRARRLNAHRANFMQMVSRMGTYISDAKQRQVRAVAMRKQARIEIEAGIINIRKQRWHLVQLRATETHMAALIKRYQRLHDFVHRIIGDGNLFTDLDSVVRRHRSLLINQASLAIKHEEATKELNKLKEELFKLRNDGGVEKMHFQMLYIRQCARLERARDEALLEEENLRALLMKSSRDTIVMGHIGVAVLNLYRRLKNSWPGTETIDEQLAVVKDFVLQYSAAEP